jgi:hypothetical protein
VVVDATLDEVFLEDVVVDATLDEVLVSVETFQICLQ